MTQIEEKPAWYDSTPAEQHVAPVIREVLEKYSGIPEGDILNHVGKIRDEAWKVFPYPCIGQFRFVQPCFTGLSKEFDEIVKRLRNGERFLDMACCFGQAVRELVHAGAPAENIYGCDLQPDFIELGYNLFQDRERLSSKFFTADIFDPSSALANYEEYFDMIQLSRILHLWDYETQLVASKAVVKLLRPKPGSMITGSQIGAVEAGEDKSKLGTMFQHNVESFKEMWEKVGRELGVKFTVDARLTKLPKEHFLSESGQTRMIWFAIRRE